LKAGSFANIKEEKKSKKVLGKLSKKNHFTGGK